MLNRRQTQRQLEFVRFRDLSPAHVNRDLQVHAVATDGQATIGELIARAEQEGLAEIAFTEHVRRTSTYYQGFADEVRAARRNATIKIYMGVETKALDEEGTLDITEERLGERPKSCSGASIQVVMLRYWDELFLPWDQFKRINQSESRTTV